MAIQLANAVACVTGGGRGIGKETARLLAAKGAEVWIGDIDLALAERAAAELGPRVRAHHLDVTDPSSFEAYLKAPGRPVSMLVNNAGVMHVGRFQEIDLKSHLREIAIDLDGVIIGTHLVLPGMLARNEGHIVNVSSMAGKLTIGGFATYNAAKFGVAAFSRALRSELAHTRVTVSTMMPAAVRTELTSGISTRGVPLLQAADIAAAIVDSARGNGGEMSVPRWAAQLGIAEELLPEALFDRIKRLAYGKKLDEIDREKRKAYSVRA